MKRALLATLLALLPAGPSFAALVSDYTMTDDVWTTPIPVGKFLLDARATYSSSDPSVVSPLGSLVYGLAPNVEVGLFGGYSLTGLGLTNGGQAPVPLTPYLKVQLPWTLGSTSFGLVAGAQIPTQASTERNAALEGVAIIPLSSEWSLDLNLGMGQNFLNPATLGHVSGSLYYAIPGGHSVLLEGFSYLSTAAAPLYGQRVGYLHALTSSFMVDASVAANETMGGPTLLIPQVGTCLTF